MGVHNLDGIEDGSYLEDASGALVAALHQELISQSFNHVLGAGIEGRTRVVLQAQQSD